MSIFIFLFLFCSRYLQDHKADLHQIFQEDGKWAAIEKLTFRFMNSFGCRRDVQKGYFRFGPSFTKCNIAAKWIYLSEKESRLILAVWFLYQTLKNARKPIKGRTRCFGAFGANINTEVLDTQRRHRAMLTFKGPFIATQLNSTRRRVVDTFTAWTTVT